MQRVMFRRTFGWCRHDQVTIVGGVVCISSVISRPRCSTEMAGSKASGCHMLRINALCNALQKFYVQADRVEAEMMASVCDEFLAITCVMLVPRIHTPKYLLWYSQLKEHLKSNIDARFRLCAVNTGHHVGMQPPSICIFYSARC